MKITEAVESDDEEEQKPKHKTTAKKAKTKEVVEPDDDAGQKPKHKTPKKTKVVVMDEDDIVD